MEHGDLVAQLLKLRPCAVIPCEMRPPSDPDICAKIRAAAEPQPPAARIEVHPYYLEQLDVEAHEQAQRALRQYQDQVAEMIREGMVSHAYRAGMMELYRYVDCT